MSIACNHDILLNNYVVPCLKDSHLHNNTLPAFLPSKMQNIVNSGIVNASSSYSLVQILTGWKSTRSYTCINSIKILQVFYS